ncbi:MAG: PQQ-like beta-propeller repeat protein [Lentisphaeria bacterium]|nr:PQQ-like beta-propeller repeat protein [Lentisphaeria bacterium]
MVGICVGGLLSAWVVPVTAGADWPQYRGPNRDGVSAETGLLKQWPEGGPRELWWVSGIGEGYSSAAVAGGKVYVTGMREKREFATALDRAGKQLWQTEYGSAYRRSFPQARCTPTVEGERLYIISGAGEVVCLDAGTGTTVWSVPAFDEFGGRTGPWGTAESPLVVDGKVIYTPAGPKTTMVAFEKDTGKLAWQSESLDDQSGYVSPILVEYGGRRSIVTVTGKHVLGVNPADGAIVWKVAYHTIQAPKSGYDINAVAPLFHAGRIFVTSGYDHAGVMLRLAADASAAEVVWTSPDLDTHHGGVVRVGAHIYGANWVNNKEGKWVCLDWDSGRTRYQADWNTKGSIVAAEGMLYCYDERNGSVALVTAKPEAFEVVSSFQVTRGKQQHWAHPSISDGRLYIRHGDALMAFDIKAP